MELDPSRDVTSKDLPCWERFQEAGRTRPLNVDLLYQNLMDVCRVFRHYKIKHWLSHGTFLGVVRDNQFILWDDDADIAADFSQRQLAEQAFTDLRTMGFYIPPSNPNLPIGLENCPYYDMHAIRNGEKVECWFFEKQGDSWVYDEPRCKNDLRHPAKYYDTLDTINFRGNDFPCPSFREEYLNMMYGPTWKTPDPKRKYTNNPQGI